MKLGILASGGLGARVLQEVHAKYPVNFVLTDRHSSDVIRFCEANKLSCFAGNPRQGKAAKALPGMNCDVLLSVNYLFIVEPDILAIPSTLAINVHGSLLPRYRGRTPHVWAIINGETETGITAHVMDAGCDTGDILAQKKIRIDPDDTGGTILEKFNQLYPGFILEVLDAVRTNKFTRTPQSEKDATWFGKRTPDDGCIDWTWSSERIRNWVRAQTKPYPGAFTYLQDQLLKVYAVARAQGASEAVPGEIVSVSDGLPIVRTGDGLLRITDLEGDTKPAVGDLLVKTPPLENEKVSLKALSYAHCNENYLAWFEDKEAVQYIESAKNRMSIASLKEFVRTTHGKGNYLWAIHEKGSGKHIGNLKIDAFDGSKNSAEYGILMGDRGSWGKGYATQATILAIDFCFSRLKLAQLTLGYVEDNERASALYRKLGFEEDGRISNYGQYEGKTKDVIRMKLLASKWKR